MGAVDAATAQGMATRHARSVKAVQAQIGEINALLAKLVKKGKIKWNGFGTHADWYVRKLKETSTWKSGQLGSRSFEEKDPMAQATLPFCFIDETYGVSEKSIKTNRAGGNDKIYDIQKENARNAQNALYRAWVSAIYSVGVDALCPVGLRGIVGSAYSSSSVATTALAWNYGGIAVASSAITAAWSANRATQGFANDYWYPTLCDLNDCPIATGTEDWETDAVKALWWMSQIMSYTADVSGTGKIIRPDLALLGQSAWAGLVGILAGSQTGTYGVPVGSTDPHLAAFSTVRVGTVDIAYDENVPLDSGDGRVALMMDSGAFYIHSLNSESEGLIEGEWDGSNPQVVGGVGVYKSNGALICETPHAVGIMTGLD